MNFEKTANILAEYKGIDVSEIKGESTFADLELDSLDVAELVMSIEDEFGISIEVDESVKSVSDLVKMIDGANG